MQSIDALNGIVAGASVVDRMLMSSAGAFSPRLQPASASSDDDTRLDLPQARALVPWS